MIERAHGVEGVGGADGAGVDGGAGFGGGGVGVAEGDAHAARGGVGDELDGAGKLGRERHQANVAFGSVEESIEDGDVGREQMLGGLHAALGVREKRAFEMNADRTGAAWSRAASAMSFARPSRARECGIERGGDGGGEIGAGAAEARKRADGVSASGVASMTS